MALKTFVFKQACRYIRLGRSSSLFFSPTRTWTTKPAILGSDLPTKNQHFETGTINLIPNDATLISNEENKNHEVSLERLLETAKVKKQIEPLKALEMLTTIRKLTLRNEIELNSFINDPAFQKICISFEKKCGTIRPENLIFGVKCLLEFGFPAESTLIQSLENEILWASRNMSLQTILSALELQVKYQETEQQIKIFKHLLSLINKRWIEMSSPNEAIKLIRNGKHFNEELIGKIEDHILEFADKFSNEEAVAMFTALFQLKRRSKPLLRALSYYMVQKNDELSLRQCCDLSFALSALSFHDKNLLNKVSIDAIAQLETNTKVKLVSSLMTSMSHLKWDHTDLLNKCCEWLESNSEKCNSREFMACLLTLANLNYKPENSPSFFPLLVQYLKSPDECKLSSSAWLDVVWSLAVLERVTPFHITSVLNPSFYDPLLQGDSPKIDRLRKKLQNIVGVAEVEFPMIVLPSLLQLNNTEISQLEEIEENKKDTNYSVIQALQHFLPGSKFLASNLKTGFGFDIDAEFIVDKNGTPKPILEYGIKAAVRKEIKPIPKNSKRIALLVWNFKNITLNRNGVSGEIALAVRLLTKLGYLVVEVPITEYQDLKSTIKEVQYLQWKIKDKLMQSNK